MKIYIVRNGDNINSIAVKHGVPVSRLIHENGLANPNEMVEGQALVITYPYKTHVVKEGDSLAGIARRYNITIMQLLRNNSFLADREILLPGETLVISHNTTGKTAVAGYTYSFINRNTLIKTLPYLTYLYVVNYQIIDGGNLLTYYDDSEIIDLSLAYSTIPLMGITAVSPGGEIDIEVVFNLLINESYQETFISNILNILQASRYYGVYFFVSKLSDINQSLYFELLIKLSGRLHDAGYSVFVTVNPNLKYTNGYISFQNIDYSKLNHLIDGVTFIKELRAGFHGPPLPITSVSLSKEFMDYIIPIIPSKKIYIEIPLLAYDWELPFDKDSVVRCMALSSAVSLAFDVGAVIQFDKKSMTPYFKYDNGCSTDNDGHIVRFVDARTINALLQLTADKSMAGAGIWNIMIFFHQMWSVLAAQFDIIKLLPER